MALKKRKWSQFTPGNMGALVCMSRRDMPVYPGDVIICRRSCAEPGSCLFAVHFCSGSAGAFVVALSVALPRGGGGYSLCDG